MKSVSSILVYGIPPLVFGYMLINAPGFTIQRAVLELTAGVAFALALNFYVFTMEGILTPNEKRN
jgi:hypothetical protein